jgi:DNA-binding response OmpR family regulator
MKKILLIEDNLEVAKTRKKFSPWPTTKVLTAPNGKLGVELAQHENLTLLSAIS